MDEILTYEQMVDDPDCNGLCDICPDIPFVQTPNGPSMCEGRSCEIAYERYITEHYNDPCSVCTHYGTGRCKKCTHYCEWNMKGRP